jgi:hypothetical protein
MRSLRSMDILILLSREEAHPVWKQEHSEWNAGRGEDVASARPGLILQGTKVALYLRLLSRPMNGSSSQRPKRAKMLTYVMKLHVRLHCPIFSFVFFPSRSFKLSRNFSPEFGESPASHLDP